MAAPMSFLPRVIIGATTFTVVVAGAFYIYYKSRHIFSRNQSTESVSEKSTNGDQDRRTSDEPEHRKVNLHSACTDSSVVSLISLLESEDESQLCKVLTTIANKAAFTEGQNAIHHAGGLPVIMRQLERNSDRVITCTASCIANLSLNSNNQPLLKACIPALLNLSTDPSRTQGLRLACIQALVNLSVSGHCEEYFGQPAALQSLFTLLGDGASALGQQALRVLVNLSADETVTPVLLSYNVPHGFMTLLGSHHTDESLLRTLSFLINLRGACLSIQAETVAQTSDTSISFSSLFVKRAGELTVAVEPLMHHGNADVRQQAGRLQTMLSGL